MPACGGVDRVGQPKSFKGKVLGWVDIGYNWFGKMTSNKKQRFFSQGFGRMDDARTLQNTLLADWARGGLPWADDRAPLQGLRWIQGRRAHWFKGTTAATAAEGEDIEGIAAAAAEGAPEGAWFKVEPMQPLQPLEEEAEFDGLIRSVLPECGLCNKVRFLLVQPATGVAIRCAADITSQSPDAMLCQRCAAPHNCDRRGGL